MPCSLYPVHIFVKINFFSIHTLHSTALTCTALLWHAMNMQWNARYCYTLHPTELTWTAFWWTSLHCTALRCTELLCTTLHWTALRCIALHFTSLHCTSLHCTALHCIALHCTAQHCTALHCTSMNCTSPHWPSLHCNTLFKEVFKRGFICSDATMPTRRESQCLPYAGFFFQIFVVISWHFVWCLINWFVGWLVSWFVFIWMIMIRIWNFFYKLWSKRSKEVMHGWYKGWLTGHTNIINFSINVQTCPAGL